MTTLISGKKIAQDLISSSLIPRVKLLNKKCVQPKLIVILIGEDPASQSYVRQKKIFAKKAGILSEVLIFPTTISESDILYELKKINKDPTVHGVIVQLPVPKHISVEKILNTIDPKKDVDGFTTESIGKLFLSLQTFACATPKGIVRMLKEANVTLSGKNVVIVGRSNTVGKPTAMLCLQENATVTICHSKTKDLATHLKKAEIVIAAVGKPEFIQGDQLSKGCIVIDVGVHRKPDGKLCGDVHFESASKVASKISPVPGGVGPMTVFSLIENTIESAERTAGNLVN